MTLITSCPLPIPCCEIKDCENCSLAIKTTHEPMPCFTCTRGMLLGTRITCGHGIKANSYSRHYVISQKEGVAICNHYIYENKAR